MKLVMTLLVRDEQDIIRTNIEYHLAQGVDFFLAADNRSVDATADILRRYDEAGLLRYTFESGDDYNQHAWVTHMARTAFLEYGADWVINNDADEFWWPLEGNLKEVFERLPREVNVLEADRHNFVPVEDSGEPFWSRMVYREKVPVNVLGKPLPPKVAHRGAGDVTVSQGNHSVTGFGPTKKARGALEIFHFPVRGYAQFSNKIIKGGAAYERNRELPKAVGGTWRKLYEEYRRDGNVERYFRESYFDTARLAEGLRTGQIIEDRRLAHYLSDKLASPMVR